MKLIDKDALVAEIEKRKQGMAGVCCDYISGQQVLIAELLFFINSLEVKEVDLNEEIDKFWKPRFSLGWDDKSLLSVSYKGFEIIAKHFFELGLSINRRDTNMPVIDSMLLEKGIDPYSKEAKLFKERCFAAIDAAIEILKAQKGEKL